MNSLLLRRIFLIALLICGCANSVAPVHRIEGNHAKHVFIVHGAWHAAIIIKTIDIPAVVLPEIRDFPSTEHLEFSWGDRDYFPAPDPGIGLALKAAFWSSGSVLHVVGSNGGRFYPAKGKFSILRTCNTWVAEALNAAGLPVSSRHVITAGSLAGRVRSLAEKQQ